MTSEYKKNERKQLLKKIIKENEIGDQIHLLEELKKKGFDATQATISRDLQEMGISKVRGSSGIYKYEVIENISEDVILNKLQVLFENFVYEILRTGNLILLKTSPGNANGVGSFLDRLERKEILGTIAGDDTILVIVDLEKNSIIVEKEFISILENTLNSKKK